MPPPGFAFWLIVVWLIAIGGAVGSFLNVVVYRLPLGISLVHPPSRCPKCEKRIPWYDNVPVFGWIWLRGRCRQCQNPISARYPIVEALTAAMFGAVAAVELLHFPMHQFTIIYPCHMLLLCTLLCAGLIEYDDNRPPWRLFLPAFLVGFAISVGGPILRLLYSGPELLLSEDMPAWTAVAIDGWAGLVAGSLFGLIAWKMFGNEKPTGLAFGLIYVGLFLGWQAVAIIAVCTAVLIAPLWLPERVSPRLRIPGSIFLWVVALAWILAAGWVYPGTRLVSFWSHLVE